MLVNISKSPDKIIKEIKAKISSVSSQKEALEFVAKNINVDQNAKIVLGIILWNQCVLMDANNKAKKSTNEE